MQIGDTVRITTPKGGEKLFTIQNKKDVSYYERFPVGEYQLDVLPKVTIHMSDNNCVACEG